MIKENTVIIIIDLILYFPLKTTLITPPLQILVINLSLILRVVNTFFTNTVKYTQLMIMS